MHLDSPHFPAFIIPCFLASCLAKDYESVNKSNNHTLIAFSLISFKYVFTQKDCVEFLRLFITRQTAAYSLTDLTSKCRLYADCRVGNSSQFLRAQNKHKLIIENHILS